MASAGAKPAYEQKHSADKDVKAMETCGHVEGGREHTLLECKFRMGVFIYLEAQEDGTQGCGKAQPKNGFFVLAFENGVVRPCDGASRQQ